MPIEFSKTPPGNKWMLKNIMLYFTALWYNALLAFKKTGFIAPEFLFDSVSSQQSRIVYFVLSLHRRCRYNRSVIIDRMCNAETTQVKMNANVMLLMCLNFLHFTAAKLKDEHESNINNSSNRLPQPPNVIIFLADDLGWVSIIL